jgi:uncharacterized protein (TIGR00730 family)
MKRVCVFCGSSPGANPEFTAQARRLAAVFAERGLDLVFGGGNVGLMAVIADAVLAAGRKVHGVIPRALVDRELAHHGLTSLDVVATMHERKQRMHDLSDGFIALPGGFGTLDELFEALTWSQLGVHQKPCGLLEVDGYFAPLVQFLDGAVSSQLLRPEHRALLVVDDDPGRLVERMAAFRAPSVPKWISRQDI